MTLKHLAARRDKTRLTGLDILQSEAVGLGSAETR
jgi:hypothetical protein